MLVTHVGKLPRTPELDDATWDRLDGDEQASALVKAQVALGIDIVNDGEPERSNYVYYLASRVEGLNPGGDHLTPADLADYPGFEAPGRAKHQSLSSPLACTSRLVYTGSGRTESELARLVKLTAGAPDRFMAAPSPGVVAMFIENRHYTSEEAYLDALAGVLAHEYRAIVESGTILQIDCPDLAAGFHTRRDGRVPTYKQFRKLMRRNIAYLEQAIHGLPAERVRVHVCWGNYEGPHHHDVPFIEIVDELAAICCGAISFEAANPRHCWETDAWGRLAACGKTLIPGLIDTATAFVEPVELITARLRTFTDLTSPDRVIAGTDCGCRPRVDSRIAWAKLRNLVTAARSVGGHA